MLEPTSNWSSCSTSLIQEDSEEAARPGLTFGIGTGPHCGCGPQDLLWRNSAGSYEPTGNWDSSCSLVGCTGCDNYHCQFGPAPESGMGAVYANGFRTPSGVLLSILRSAKGRQLVKMSVTAVSMLEAKGVYALAWYQGEHVAELVLSNHSPGLPSVLELIPTAIRVLKAMRLAQSSNESRDVSGLDGFNSTVPLLGTVLPAAAPIFAEFL